MSRLLNHAYFLHTLNKDKYQGTTMEKSTIETITGMSNKAFWLLALVFALMLIYAYFIPLHPDEAYYWMWSRHLAFGYYDGPPLTAWDTVITALFGIHTFNIKLIAVTSSHYLPGSYIA